MTPPSSRGAKRRGDPGDRRAAMAGSSLSRMSCATRAPGSPRRRCAAPRDDGAASFAPTSAISAKTTGAPPPLGARGRRFRPESRREAAKPLKRLKTAIGSYWKKLAWIWVWRHVCLGLAPHPLGFGAAPAWGQRGAPANFQAGPAAQGDKRDRQAQRPQFQASASLGAVISSWSFRQ